MNQRFNVIFLLSISLIILMGFNNSWSYDYINDAGNTIQVNSDGRIEGDIPENRPEPTCFTQSGGSILVFNSYYDVADRLRDLGYTVTETSSVVDLNTSNLQNFDVLWISACTNPNLYSSQNSDIQTWVAQYGGGLIVNQPNITGAITVFPDSFEVSIYDTRWPGGSEATIVNPSHPITNGLTDDDISHNYDWVKESDIGENWEILTVDAETPSAVALLAGEYSNGRLVFNTNNLCAASGDPGSDTYLIQMVDWAASGQGGPNCTLELDLSYSDTTLNISLDVGTSEVSGLNLWISFMNEMIPLISGIGLPALDPAVSIPISIPGFPSLGNIGVLTTLMTEDGITCSEWDTVDTGPMQLSADQAIDQLNNILKTDK